MLFIGQRNGKVDTSRLCNWTVGVMCTCCPYTFFPVNCCLCVKIYKQCLVSFANFVIVLINCNRTLHHPILSVILLVIHKSVMITDQIGFHSVLFMLLIIIVMVKIKFWWYASLLIHTP